MSVCVRARVSGSLSVVPSYYPQSLRKNVSAENLQLNYLNKLGSLCVWDLPHKSDFNGNLCLNGFTLWFAMWISTRFVDYMNYLAPDCIWHIITFAHRTLNSKSEFFLMQRFGRSLYVCLTFWGLGNTTTEEPPSHRNHSGSGFRQGLRLGAGSCVHIFDRDGATTSCEAI